MKHSLDFYSHGKLMISGEYLVIDGALSLALPVRFGQSLHVEIAGGPPHLHWESRVRGKEWFTADFQLPGLKIISTNDQEVALRLQTLLENAASLNPDTLNQDAAIHVLADIGFDLNTGLGSSSSLISNIAWWFDVDPFQLFRDTYTGSGYDIACARSPHAILYRLTDGHPVIQQVKFDPPFRQHIYFVHLGRKQDTHLGIRHYRGAGRAGQKELERISAISNQLVKSKELLEFEDLLTEHETIVGRILGIVPVKQTLFTDFQGTIKSLGAWGGDFILATWSGNRQEMEDYFHSKGLRTIYAFDELIL
jgi:mevalonate kinase